MRPGICMKRNMQRIKTTADGRRVVLTDSAREARLLQRTEPVIGICSPGSDQSWSGISFLAEDWDSVDDEYLKLAYCRYFHLPRVLPVSGKKWKIREAAKKDAKKFWELYEDEDVQRYLAYPLSKRAHGISDWEDWIESLHRYVYPSEEPSMWVLADENDEMMGRIGFEYKEEKELPAGYYLGYALLPKWRKKGLAAEAASRLVAYCMEYWQLDEVCLLCDCQNIASVKTALACGFVCTQNLCLKDVVEHRLDLCAGIGTGKLLLFTRKRL